MFLSIINRWASPHCNVGGVRFLRGLASAAIHAQQSLEVSDPNFCEKDDGVFSEEVNKIVRQRELRLRDRARNILISTPKIGELLLKDPGFPIEPRNMYAYTTLFGSPPSTEDLCDGREQAAAGIRAFNAIKALLAKHDKSVEDLTFAIQGFENVGSWIAFLVHEGGGKVVAVGEVSGVAVRNREGIDIIALLKHMERNRLSDFSGAYSIGADELLASKCDVLVPVGRTLSRKHAEDVKAKFVMKNVNYPTHRAGEEMLSEKGVLILDVLGSEIASEDDEKLLENYVENAIAKLVEGWEMEAAKSFFNSIEMLKKRTYLK